MWQNIIYDLNEKIFKISVYTARSYMLDTGSSLST